MKKEKKGCKICGSENTKTKIETPHRIYYYCHECYISILGAENLLEGHEARVLIKHGMLIPKKPKE